MCKNEAEWQSNHNISISSTFFGGVPEFSWNLKFKKKSAYFEIIFKRTMTLKVQICIPLEFYFYIRLLYFRPLHNI